MYKHPGVYIEHVPSGALAIEAASTSIACFIGEVPRGPIGAPVFITNRGAFAQQFGELDDATSGIRDYGDVPDYFGHAVNAFYDNGGQQAYILRVAGGNSPAHAKGALRDPDSAGIKAFYLTAANEGSWGNKLRANLKPVDSSDLDLGYVLEIGWDLVEDGMVKEMIVLESFSGVVTDKDKSAYIPTVLAAQSELVTCEHLELVAAGASSNFTALQGGSLQGLAINDVKGKTLTMEINGTATTVAFNADLINIEVVQGPKSVSYTHQEGAPAVDTPIDGLERLAVAFENALNAHEDIDGFNIYIGDDQNLVLMPPAGNPAAVTVTNDAGAQVLGLGNGATVVEMPAAEEAFFLLGKDGNSAGTADFDTALATLRDYRNISIIVMPGKSWESNNGGQDVLNKAISHSEFMKNRVVIVDSEQSVKLETPKNVKDQGFPNSTFSSLYYPWVEVNNPHYDADTKANRPQTLKVPPSGLAAGMWARIDASRGVWKAPAGLEATVRGVRGTTELIGNDIQDQLNEWGINCIRNIVGPPVIWGARTLATKVKPDQRYVPVRRTSAMIGESLYNALQAVVFEPNKHTLWAILRAGANDFMDGLYRAGAFQGEKASEAYYVRCGLGQTMTQADIDAGIVRLVVGYAPLKPAEFVVVQLKQIVGQAG